MKIISYDRKRLTAEIEWRGKIRTLSEEAVKKAGYDIQKELPDDKIEELLLASEEVLCYAYLLNQISQYRKTAKGYLKKLLEKGFSYNFAKNAVEKAQSFGYIDDRQYAERFIESNLQKKGYYKLKNDLLSKGVPSDIVEEALENLPSQEDEILVLAKKLAKNAANTPEERAKLYRKLASRGFSYDDIKRATDIIFGDE